MVDGGSSSGIIGIDYLASGGIQMSKGFRKAISREGHVYHGVVYDIELCDEGGGCASLVTKVGAGEIVDWRESHRGDGLGPAGRDISASTPLVLQGKVPGAAGTEAGPEISVRG